MSAGGTKRRYARSSTTKSCDRSHAAAAERSRWHCWTYRSCAGSSPSQTDLLPREDAHATFSRTTAATSKWCSSRVFDFETTFSISSRRLGRVVSRPPLGGSTAFRTSFAPLPVGPAAGSGSGRGSGINFSNAAWRLAIFTESASGATRYVLDLDTVCTILALPHNSRCCASAMSLSTVELSRTAREWNVRSGSAWRTRRARSIEQSTGSSARIRSRGSSNRRVA
mmetsp:Transcript_1161/g.2978  ORF Transcript_1161/g.2978 Transcript_1161/m.2978 type:complete len:225 (-) Transcript_1161:369-1043(-)